MHIDHCTLGQHEWVPLDGKWICAYCDAEPPKEEEVNGTDCRLGGGCE